MAKLSKEVYERKNEWAARRMERNSKIESLTEEQHEFLAELCSFRHFLHTNKKRAFLSESSESREISDEISVWGEQSLCGRCFDLFGEYPFEPIDYPDDNREGWGYFFEDFDPNKDYDDKTREDWYFKAYDMATDMFEQINTEIETFLEKIDEKYGTDYCPSGISRNADLLER